MAGDEDSGWETTDVVICGAGPTGVTLSAYLGQLSVHNIVLEKYGSIFPDPRAFSLGEEGMRIVQGVGLYKHLYTEIGRKDLGIAAFITCPDHDLSRTPFFRLDVDTVTGYTGHTRAISFEQPVLERLLRSTINRSDYSQLRTECNLYSIAEDRDWVYLSYKDRDSKNAKLRCKALVGADGKTGFVRKQYLEAKGVVMERTHPQQQEVYVALQWEVKRPTPQSHPDFPLWLQGYDVEQVYDAFIPKNFVFACNPNRPAAMCRIGAHTNDPQLWRFEFATLEGEDPEEMRKPEKYEKILLPYLTHRGNRYELTQDVSFPKDCLRLRRSVAYTFAAKTCNRWHEGRVMLAGDSAHVFPPFGGQGVQTGMMDATGLAWRLAIATRSEATTEQLDRLLTSWTTERRQHVQFALAYTVRNGALFTERNTAKMFFRDWLLWLLQLVPAWRRQMQTPHPKPITFNYEAGAAFLPDLGGGASLMQVYCVPIESALHSKPPVVFSDDLIYASDKQSLFQLVVLVDNLDELAQTESLLSEMRKELPNATKTMIMEATYIVHHKPEPHPLLKTLSSAHIARVAKVEEFRQSDLSRGRPETSDYDPYSIQKAVGGSTFVIVRPDRVIFAACRHERGLERAFDAMERVLAFEDL